VLTFEQITELIGLVAHHRLQGLTLEQEGFRFEIQGYEPQPVVTMAAPAPMAHAAAPVSVGPAATAPAAAAPAAPASAAEPLAPPAGHVLTSPIVGTFYAAPSPDAQPFVRVGDRVKKGQVLCIVEAMKLMNEIESDVDGTISEILPKNGQPVEYGEPLFAIAEG
jgi:acetyl-CoA carboxylase biotin carboxyl carrier protein